MLTAESSTIVTLDLREWEEAAALGRRRHEEAEIRGYRQTDGTYSANGGANHVSGAPAEIAPAKLFGIKWDATINGYGKIPDLLCCEVRSTLPATPHLRVKMTDSPIKKQWIFILVTRLGNRQYRVESWAYGYEAMRSKYYVERDRHSGKPEWHMPIRDMHPPFTLHPVLLRLRALLRGESAEEDA